MKFFFQSIFSFTNYGIDEEASIPLDDIQIQTGNNVVVPSCPFQLSEEEITTLKEILNPLIEIQRCIVKQHLAFFCAQ